MLEKLRKGAASWVAKALIGLLILSFAVWGIADMISGRTSDTVATVGDRKITETEFRDAYQAQLAATSRQFGQQLNTEQARLFGVPQQTVQRLLSTAAVDEHARRLGLAVSSQSIVDAIRTDPTFQDATGNFSKPQFDQLLRDAGLNEPRYLVERGRQTVREQLTDSMIGAIPVPAELIATTHSFRTDARKVRYVVLDAATIAKPGEPTEAQITETYEQNKRRFVAPESRRVGVLLLSADALKAAMQISDADIAATYEAQRSSYGVPEKRRVEQISFKTVADAEAAAKALADGKSFAEIAKAQGATESDIALGLVARTDLIDPKIAEAAFTLEKDKISKPVEGRFTTVLLRVSEIQPGRQQPLEEVKQVIRDQLANERVGTDVQKAHDAVDDLKLKGKSPTEIAETLKLKYLDIAAVSKDGNGPDGKPALDVPDAARIIQTAFATTVGVESEVVELADGGYAWVNALGSTPERQRPLEDVKAEVVAAWREGEVTKALRSTADKLVEALNTGKDFEALAKEGNLTLKATPEFNRRTSVPDLSATAVAQTFTLTKGKAASATGADGKSRVVFQLTDVIPAPAPTKAQEDALRAELQRQRQVEVLAEYVTGLRNSLGTAIDQATINRILGISSQP